LGRALRPMIDNFFAGRSALSSSSAGPSIPTPPPGPIPYPGPTLPPGPTPPLGPTESSGILNISTLTDLRSLIASNPAVVVFFTSFTCGPCKVIEPEFSHLVEEANSTGTRKSLVGIKVDISLTAGIADVYNVTATPTFMFFVGGEKVGRA